ncbi:alpha/beta hydrolase-fold protein [uncultured Castellaniella sp.]|jgi:phospholipase/carboxylesterase|uniref:alpha/beta hydrolase n=1 Tax=uncultured Castellaniella sp. TaxID=647907 RepID=UPI00260C979B|nr:alpha/beta hydrolase-fold protein [uncultured Castellaniella sp.]
MNDMSWSALRTDRTLAFRTNQLSGSAQRLLVLLHGVGGNETNLAPFAETMPADTRVVLVRAPLTLGAGQHAWFQVSFGPQGPRPDLTAAESSRQQLVRFIAELQAEYAASPARTVVAGFSQGGIMSASLGLTRPGLVAGFGVLAGRILPELEPQLAKPAALAGIRAFIGHGRDDTKLPVAWAHRSDAWLTSLGVPHETRLYPGDHGIPQAMQMDFASWLVGLAR